MNVSPLSVDDINANAISASFCIISCSEDTISMIGVRPPNLIICSDISVIEKETKQLH